MSAPAAPTPPAPGPSAPSPSAPSSWDSTAADGPAGADRPTSLPLPPGIPGHWTVRPLAPRDAPAIVDVLAAEERAHPAEVHVDLAETSEMLTGPRVDLARGTLGVFDGEDLIAFGLVLAMTTPASATGTWSGYLDGAVHPDHERRGLGRWLVENGIARAGLLRDRMLPELPAELKMGLTPERPAVAAVARACGMEVWRYFIEMRRPLDTDLPPVTAVPGYTVRPYRAEDEEAVRLVSNESFADHWGSSAMDAATWHSQFAASSSFRPAASRLAVTDDGRIASFVHVAEFDADTAQNGFRTAYIGRVGTAREHRGRGVASAVLAATLPDLAADGYARAELDVDAASPTGAGRIYERLGFRTAKQRSTAGLRIPPRRT